VSVHDLGSFQVQDPGEVPHANRIGNRQVMLPFTCVNPGQLHRQGLEPVHPRPGGKNLSVERSGDVLGRDGDLMPARGKDIRQIKYMPFLTADIGREELSSEQNTHQVILYPPARHGQEKTPAVP
jgi:hypothetical protein